MDALSVEEVLQHVRAIVDATDLPVNVDFQDGYGRELHDVRNNVRSCVDAGAAGLSIEDASGNAELPQTVSRESVWRGRRSTRAVPR